MRYNKKNKILKSYGFLYGKTLFDQDMEFSNLASHFLVDKNGVFVGLGLLNDCGLVAISNINTEQLVPFTFDEIADIIQAVIIEEVTL